MDPWTVLENWESQIYSKVGSSLSNLQESNVKELIEEDKTHGS